MNIISTVELCQRAELEWKLKHRNIQTSVLLRKPFEPSDKVSSCCLVSIGTVKKTSKRSKFSSCKTEKDVSLSSQESLRTGRQPTALQMREPFLSEERTGEVFLSLFSPGCHIEGVNSPQVWALVGV